MSYGDDPADELVAGGHIDSLIPAAAGEPSEDPADDGGQSDDSETEEEEAEGPRRPAASGAVRSSGSLDSLRQREGPARVTEPGKASPSAYDPMDCTEPALVQPALCNLDLRLSGTHKSCS